MQLVDLPGFRQQVERWQMCWERDCVAPRFGSNDPESPWPWPRSEGFTRRWELANFFVDALAAAALNKGGGFYLCPPGGRWSPRDQYLPFYRIRNVILAGIGIPTEYDGVAFFQYTEIDQLAAAVFARCFMIDDRVGDAGDDVWLYPDHGQIYLHFDDEEITWGMAARREPLREFDAELERRGWGWLRDKERNEWDWPLEF